MNTSNKTKSMILVALVAAITCILGPLSLAIPISPVPISLTVLTVFLGTYVLGMKLGTMSVLLYLLIGLVGLPVFSGFTGGPAKLLGPTGGYLIGFIFMALTTGFCIDRFEDKRLMHLAGMIVGTAVCYALGTAWLAYQTGMGFGAALGAGVIPFIPGDAVKMIITLIIGPVLRKSLRRANLI